MRPQKRHSRTAIFRGPGPGYRTGELTSLGKVQGKPLPSTGSRALWTSPMSALNRPGFAGDIGVREGSHGVDTKRKSWSRVSRCKRQTIAPSNRFAIEAASGLSRNPVNPRHNQTCVLSLSAAKTRTKQLIQNLLPSLSRSRERTTSTGCGTRLAHPLHRRAPHRCGRGRGHVWLPQ